MNQSAAHARDDANTGASRQIERTVALEPGGSLAVHTFKGLVEVEAWDRPEVEIHAEIRPPKGVSESYGRETVEKTELVVEDDGAALRVAVDSSEVPYDENARWRLSGWRPVKRNKAVPEVRLRIRAPRRLSLRFEDFKSRLVVRGFEGDLEVQTFKSTVHLADLDGTVAWHDHKGSLRLEGHRGSLGAQSKGGKVEAGFRELRGESSIGVGKGTAALTLPAAQAFRFSGSRGKRSSYHGGFDLGAPWKAGDSVEVDLGAEAGAAAPATGEMPRVSVQVGQGSVRLERR